MGIEHSIPLGEVSCFATLERVADALWHCRFVPFGDVTEAHSGDQQQWIDSLSDDSTFELQNPRSDDLTDFWASTWARAFSWFLFPVDSWLGLPAQYCASLRLEATATTMQTKFGTALVIFAALSYIHEAMFWGAIAMKRTIAIESEKEP